MLALLAWGLVAMSATSATAQPRNFAGIDEALPSYRAAALRWRRATASTGGGTVRYLVFQNGTQIAEVQGQDHVVLDLIAGTSYTFSVQAIDNNGTTNVAKSLSVVPLAAPPAQEFRGAWITRFEWPSSSTTTMRNTLTSYMQRLGQGNFNAVAFQVRGQGDTLYPSTLEPRSPLLPTATHSFDPVAYAMAEARANGLEFHAWINLLVIWQGATPPSNQNHPFYRWTNPTDPTRALGAIYTAPGVQEGIGDSSYFWLTSGNPELETYLRTVVMDFVNRYEPDGLHWDDRTAMPTTPSFDPVSLQRFSGRGNPNNVATLAAWQIEQVERLLLNIYVQATDGRPRFLISASPFGIYDKNRIPGYRNFSDCLRDFGTDPEAWMRGGALDALMPQIYWREGDPEPNYGTLVRDWLANNTSGRYIWPGSALGNYGGTQPIEPWQRQYVALTRALGANGNLMYSISSANFSAWAGASANMHPNKATIPRPDYKTTRGQFAVRAFDGDGAPITDVWVRLEGRSFVYLTSADGFCGIPNVATGPQTLTATDAEGRVRTATVNVQPGVTHHVEFRFGAVASSGIKAY